MQAFFYTSAKMSYFLLILSTVILSTCSSTLAYVPAHIPNPIDTPHPSASPTPTQTPLPAPTATSTPTLSPKQSFINILNDRIDRDINLHPTAKQTTANLIFNEAAVRFDASSGLILQFNMEKTSTNYQINSLAATQLIFTAFSAAKEQQLPLNGIEVVFFNQDQNPLLVFQSQPPWKYKDIQVSLSAEYIRQTASKGDLPVASKRLLHEGGSLPMPLLAN